MPDCVEYKINISYDSPVFSLYQGLKEQQGMKDEDIARRSHHFIDYSKPYLQPALVGADDCTIETADVLESVDIYDKLCSLIDGGPDCKDPIEIVSQPTSDKIATAIKIANDALNGKDNFDIKMGTAMFYFAGMPTAEQLKSLSKGQIRSFNDRLAVLDRMGLKALGSHLKNNGGLGLFLMYRDNWLEAGADDASLRGRGGDTEKAKILYSLFEKAGLKPEFGEMDLTGKVKGTSFAQVRPIVVGLRGQNNDHTLFSFDFDANDKELTEKFYPMNARHYFIAELVNRTGAVIEFYDDQRANDTQVSSIVIDAGSGRKFNHVPTIDLIVQLSGNDSTAYRPWLLDGYKKLNKGNPGEAEVSIKKAAELNPFCWEAFYFLGRAFSEQKKYAEAKEALNRSLQINPKHAWAYLELGRIFEAAGESKQAVEAFNSAVATDQYFPEGSYALAKALYDSGDKTAALENISKALLLDFQYAEALHLRGKILKENGLAKEAVDSFSESLKYAKSYWPLYSSLVPALCELNDEDRANEVLSVFKTELNNASLPTDELTGPFEETKVIQKTCGSPQIYSAIYAFFGDKFLKGNSFESALDAYSLAGQMDPGDIDLGLKRSMILMLLNRPEDASKVIDEMK